MKNLIKDIVIKNKKILFLSITFFVFLSFASVSSLHILFPDPKDDDIRITDATGISSFSSAVTETDGDVHMVWHDNRTGDYEIFYNQITALEKSIVWQNDLQLTHCPGESMFPYIAIDNLGNIHVVWQDNRDGNWEIYYKKLDNTGVSITGDERVTNDPAYSLRPTINIDSSNNVHISWYDNRTGNYELYWDKRVEPDLHPRNLIFTPASPLEGEEIKINVTVENLGDNSAIGVQVELLVNSSSVETKSIDLDPQSNQTLTFSWTALFGTYDIAIKVDPSCLIAEINENNNLVVDYITGYRISNFTNSSIWADATIRHSVDLDVTIEKVDDPNATGTPNNINKFVNFTAEPFFNNAIIRIGYNESELQGMGIAEETLLMYYWDPYDSEGERWVRIDDSGVNVIGDYVWANVSQFSIFAPLAPEEFVLNLDDFPMYEADDPPKEMCGPAVAKMTLDYIWWNSSQNPEGPPDLYNQSDLYQAGLENNTNQSSPYLDTRGLWYIIQYNKPMPYSEYGYNFMKYNNEDLNEMLKRICLWINYTIGTVGGYKPGHPLHVPAVVPAYGGYTNWMAIRGFHANRTAHPMPDEIMVYGFWVNDPYPSSLGGLGENSYKMLATWVSDYYQPLVTDDVYNGKYVAIFEPPEITNDVELTIAVSPPRFNPEQQQIIKQVQTNIDGVSEDLREQTDQWIIDAAIEGVAEHLIPYDDDFAAAFAKTIAGTPIFVENTNGNNYYAVPFNVLVKKSRSLDLSKKIISKDNTIIVILIDAEDGSFKEASWIKDPVKYLPISKENAQKIVYEILEEMGYDPGDIESITMELVHRDSTLYYPDWNVTIDELGLEFFISQDGTVS